jgi:hypothetical protein
MTPDLILVCSAYLYPLMTSSSIWLRSVFIVVTLFCLGCGELRAQEPTPVPFPQASQHASVKQRVGLTDFEIDYSRPNKNKRDIFGGVVPFDKVWRTGANGATKIKFTNAVKFGDKEVAPGEYALFTIPKANEWTIILSKNLELPYKQESDVARITAAPVKVAEELETFTIGFNDLRTDSATMFLAWDRTVVPIKLKTNDIAKVSQQIDAAIKSGEGLDANFYNNAAGFYLDQNKDLKQAAEWIDKAIAEKPDAYFMYSRKAQIQAKLGNKKEAIAAAEKSNQILESRPERDESAIRNNQLLIESLR